MKKLTFFSLLIATLVVASCGSSVPKEQAAVVGGALVQALGDANVSSVSTDETSTTTHTESCDKSGTIEVKSTSGAEEYAACLTDDTCTLAWDAKFNDCTYTEDVSEECGTGKTTDIVINGTLTYELEFNSSYSMQSGKITGDLSFKAGGLSIDSCPVDIEIDVDGEPSADSTLCGYTREELENIQLTNEQVEEICDAIFK